MADPKRSWTVLDNGPLERLEDNLWMVRGSLPGLFRIIPGHGDPVLERPAEVLARVASRL